MEAVPIGMLQRQLHMEILDGRVHLKFRAVAFAFPLPFPAGVLVIVEVTHPLQRLNVLIFLPLKLELGDERRNLIHTGGDNAFMAAQNAGSALIDGGGIL